LQIGNTRKDLWENGALLIASYSASTIVIQREAGLSEHTQRVILANGDKQKKSELK
jgi:hypothetical protein